MNKRALLAACVAAAVGGYWYFSPYVALHGIQSAAKEQDPDKLNAYVDYPKLRESLKGEVTARMATNLAKRSGSDLEKAGSALGMMLGMAMVDGVIDAMVRPEFLMRAMNEAKVQQIVSASSDSNSGAEGRKGDVKWSLERKTNDYVVAYGSNPDGSSERVGVVLERTGFADWKLTGLRLP